MSTDLFNRKPKLWRPAMLHAACRRERIRLHQNRGYCFGDVPNNGFGATAIGGEKSLNVADGDVRCQNQREQNQLHVVILRAFLSDGSF